MSVRPSVTRSTAETTGPIFILKSGDGVDQSGDGAEGILVPLTLTNRRIKPENHEKTSLLENLSYDFDKILICGTYYYLRIFVSNKFFSKNSAWVEKLKKQKMASLKRVCFKIFNFP